jgi:hypothetical protein|tara:strand:- start:341 stop:1057 length:717 start_codon:yes stop_codon:yes gene_type:complete
MAYGNLKVDTLVYTSGGSDATITVSSVVVGNYPSLSITGTISGTVITGDTTKVTSLTGISGTFTDTVSGATITGNTTKVTTLTGISGTFTDTVSGATITGNTGKFTTLTGISGIFTDSAGFGLTSTTSGATVDVSGSYVGNAASISALNINCSSGNYFTKTIAGNSTFTISDAPASGRSYGLTLEITHTSGTITWFSGVYWPADTAPTLTEGKTHLFVFITDDGGTKWRGASLVDYSG